MKIFSSLLLMCALASATTSESPVEDEPNMIDPEMETPNADEAHRDLTFGYGYGGYGGYGGGYRAGGVYRGERGGGRYYGEGERGGGRYYSGERGGERYYGGGGERGGGYGYRAYQPVYVQPQPVVVKQPVVYGGYRGGCGGKMGCGKMGYRR